MSEPSFPPTRNSIVIPSGATGRHFPVPLHGTRRATQPKNPSSPPQFLIVGLPNSPGPLPLLCDLCAPFWRCVDRPRDASLHSAAIGQGPPIPTLQPTMVLPNINKLRNGGASYGKHRSSPRWFCGRLWLGGRLQNSESDGHNVSIVQNPTISLEDDVAVTKRVLAAQEGPAILVGHSYGGVVVTEAGNDPKVAGLVYIAAFAPDKGESVATLIQNPPPGAPVPPILPPQDGFLLLDRAKFAASFAADVDPEKAAFMADSQVPWGVAALSGKVSEPAWKTKPSWYLVATDDKMIPPDAQRAMSKRAGSTVAEAEGSHSIYVSQPGATAALIEQAAKNARAANA